MLRLNFAQVGLLGGQVIEFQIFAELPCQQHCNGGNADKSQKLVAAGRLIRSDGWFVWFHIAST